jgi:hypothetical protein
MLKVKLAAARYFVIVISLIFGNKKVMFLIPKDRKEGILFFNRLTLNKVYFVITTAIELLKINGVLISEQS